MGVLEQKVKLVDMSMAKVERVLTTNVVSAFACSQEAVKGMAVSAAGEGGSIVNVSSAASRLGYAGEYVDYAARR